ncbi:MAG: flagellar hook-associated protein FlgK, partial [Pontibacterium sp.]
MSSFSLLGLGIQGAQTNKTALSVIGQNITNANTEGYSRQETNIVSISDLRGAQVASITRVTDQFLTQQMWSDTSSYNRADAYATMASELDDRLATDSTSISTAMDNFFDSVQNVVDDPTSLPNRELFIAQSEALVQRFNDLASIIQRQQESINSDLESYSTQITAYAQEVAQLNEEISLADLAGENANELRDQREQVLTNLSELIDIRTVEQDASQINVFVGNGEPLVIGQNSNAMESIHGDPDGTRQELAVNVSGTLVNITDFVSGGRLGGLLDYRSDVLNKAENELGRIAVAFADTMNDQHQKGMTLTDDLGGLLFTDVNSYEAITSRVSAKSDNNSSLETSTVRIKDASALQASDYLVTFNSSSSFTVERISDGEVFRLSDLDSVATEQDLIDQTNAYYLDENTGVAQIAIDGFQINLDVNGKFFSGDEFHVQPSRYGAEQIGIQITDGNDLAFASPIRTTASSSNTGSGSVDVVITDINADTFQRTAGALNPPVEIVFSGT